MEPINEPLTVESLYEFVAKNLVILYERQREESKENGVESCFAHLYSSYRGLLELYDILLDRLREAERKIALLHGDDEAMNQRVSRLEAELAHLRRTAPHSVEIQGGL